MFKNLFDAETIFAILSVIIVLLIFNLFGAAVEACIWNAVIMPIFNAPYIGYWSMYWIMIFIELISPYKGDK